MKVLIQHWNAVEMLCMIDAKATANYPNFKLGEKDLNKYWDYSVVEKVIKKYLNIEFSRATSESIGLFKTTLNELARRIHWREPIVISEEEVSKIQGYLGKRVELAYETFRAWTPAPKLPLFVGRWWLYFRSVIKGEEGIVRAVLTFKPFNKVQIDTLEFRTGRDEQYLGYYDLYGNKDDFLQLFLNITPTKAKDLRIRLFVGTSVPELAAGLYDNQSEAGLTAGTLIIEPAKMKGWNLPTFFAFNNIDTLGKLEPYLIDYFRDKHLNELTVPQHIVTHSELQYWLEKEKPNRSAQ